MTGQLEGSAAQKEGRQATEVQSKGTGTFLTANQKKKRRQKLSKISKRAAFPQDLSATEEAQDGTCSVRSSPAPEPSRALRADPGLRATIPAPTYAAWGMKHKYPPTTPHSMSISEGSQSTATVMEANRCTPMACGVNDTVSISEATVAAIENYSCTSLSAHTSTATASQLAHQANVEAIDIAGGCDLAQAPVNTQDGGRPPASPQNKACLSHVAGVERDRRPEETEGAADLSCGAQQGSLHVGPLPGIDSRRGNPNGVTGLASKVLSRGPEGGSMPGIQALEAAGGARITVEGIDEGDVRHGGEVEGVRGAALVAASHTGEAAGHAEVAACAGVAVGHAAVAAGCSDMAGRARGWAAWAVIGEAHVCRKDLSSVARVMVSHIEASASNPPAASDTVACVSKLGSHLVSQAHCSTEVADEEEPPRKRQKHVAVHGNYHSYYGYRLGQGLERDPRLQVLDKRWFLNKRCLDIGCNEGVVTRDVARLFGPTSMMGVDIDPTLIAKACRSLVREREEAKQKVAELKQGPGPAAPRGEARSYAHSCKMARRAVRALQATWFQQVDFATGAELEPGSIDAVLCLSVTKWVHLNGGDEGLRTFFLRILSVLAPDGLLILEPQPWRSYQAARTKLSKLGPEGKAVHHSLETLQLRPEDFPRYLAQEIGFEVLQQLEVGTSTTGFGRPLYVLRKRSALAARHGVEMQGNV